MELHIYVYSYISIYNDSIEFEQMSATLNVKIYHNPECGTSRNTLALIRNANIEPEVINYLETPPSKNALIQIIADAGLTVREAIRKNVDPYSDLELDREDWTDEQLLNFMLQYPILINRPFVVTELGTRLSRPSELVLEILPLPQKGAFTKEDGEQVLDANGQRLK
ncbi:arsenate reductase [Acinetobacter bouvetii]|nr:arsenate reductase [Acinetobacter bouvetii]